MIKERKSDNNRYHFFWRFIKSVEDQTDRQKSDKIELGNELV